MTIHSKISTKSAKQKLRLIENYYRDWLNFRFCFCIWKFSEKFRDQREGHELRDGEKHKADD